MKGKLNKKIVHKEQKPILKTTTNAKENNKTDWFGNAIQGKEIYILLALTLVGIYIVFSDFISLKKVYLFRDIGSDSINIYYPWLLNTSRYIKEFGSLSWTFSQGMGQNLYPGSVGDFLSNFLSFFDQKNIAFGIIFTEITKIILSGVFFFNYIKLLTKSNYVSLIGAFCFSFSGYIILGSGWTIFSTEAMYAALLLLGVELYLQNKNFFVLIIAVFCISMLQPFFLFMYAIFLAIYIPIRHIDLYGNDIKKISLFFLKTIGVSALGVGLAGFQLLPTFLQYMESPRVGGEAGLSARLSTQPMLGFSDAILRFTTVFRAFSSDMLGTGNEYRGWQNYLEAPVFYCGIINLVLFPQIFIFLNKQKKIIYGILMGVFIIPLLFPFFRYSFWAFSGDYFRTLSLVITILILFFSLNALAKIEKEQKINKIVLLVNALFWIFLLLTPNEQFKGFVNTSIQGVVVFLIIIYTVLVLLLTNKEYFSIAKLAIILVVFIEMIYFSGITVNKRHVVTADDLSQKIGFNDYTVDAVNYLKKEDNSFYRINKDYMSGLAMHGSINDAQAQNYYSTASYHSFNQKNYIRFLGKTNIINTKDESSTRWASGLASRPLLLSMASNKYWLSNNNQNYLPNFGYDSINKIGNVKIFKNRYYLPLGYCYDGYILESEFDKLSNFQKDIYLLKGFVIEDEQLKKVTSLSHNNYLDTVAQFTFDIYEKLTSDLKKNTLKITSFKEKEIEGEITLSTKQLLYFSIPFDEGWKATVNNQSAELIRTNIGFSGLLLEKGKSSIKLYFEPRLKNEGKLISYSSLALIFGLTILSFNKKRNNGQNK